MKHLKIIYSRLGICIILLVSLFGMACGNNASSTNHIVIKDINSYNGLNFPDTAIVTDSIESNTLVDPVSATRVTVPKSDYPTLISDIMSKPLDGTTGYTGAYAGKILWWNPSNIVLERWYPPSPGDFTYVVVSDEGSNYVVFLEYGPE